MQGKKAQEGIIVTVLLVLVAIVAVGAIAMFIINNVKSTTNDSQSAVSDISCLKVDLEITQASTTAISVKRNDASNIVLKNLQLYVNDKLNSTIAAIGPTEATTYTINLKAGDKIRVNPVLNDSKLCANSVEKTV
jgi:flagellin-like protein